MNDTTKLFKLVEKRSLLPDNPHAYVTGFMSGFLNHLVRTCPGVAAEVRREEDRLEKEDQ
jgi:hypothetical protein